MTVLAHYTGAPMPRSARRIPAVRGVAAPFGVPLTERARPRGPW
jgi:hypothetical protein